VSNRTDSEWIRQIKLNDAQTLSDLWQLLFTWGWNLARRSGQNEENKDVGRDAAVAAFIRICKPGVNQFSFRCPFEGYCRRILVNEVNRRLLKVKPEVSPLPDDDDARSAVLEQVEPQADTAERLRPCLEALKQEEYLIVQRFYLQGVRPEVIGEELNKSRNNINQIAHRARTKLRNCLEERGYYSAQDVLSM
jgi:RNA polymerase sigma factor (sigma-70 family)